jgi:hypothetical protein
MTKTNMRHSEYTNRTYSMPRSTSGIAVSIVVDNCTFPSCSGFGAVLYYIINVQSDRFA